MISSKNLFHFVNVRHTSFHTPTASLTEQVGQEILANLHSDREKIQRARERVSAHVSALIARETLKMLELPSSIGSSHYFLQMMT